MANKEKIAKFFSALDKITHKPGDLYDLGLIVSDTLKVKDLLNYVPKLKKSEIFNLSLKVSSDDFLKALIKAFKSKKWFIIELIDGYLPGAIYNQLRLLVIQNRLQILNLNGEEKEINLRMPKESRVIFLTNQKSLSKIDNPTFLKLFGPIIKI